MIASLIFIQIPNVTHGHYCTSYKYCLHKSCWCCRISMCASIFLLMASAVERYLAICRPHYYTEVSTGNINKNVSNSLSDKGSAMQGSCLHFSIHCSGCSSQYFKVCYNWSLWKPQINTFFWRFFEVEVSTKCWDFTKCGCSEKSWLVRLESEPLTLTTHSL